jgi:hypothetical protein
MFVNATERVQADLEFYIPEIPKDSVNGILRSFAYSFTVSTLVSGLNPIAGLSGGAISILATAVHIIFMTGMKYLETYLSRQNGKPTEPISLEGRQCAFLLSWGGALYLGNALGLAINYKVSFFAMIPLVILSHNTPTMSTMVMM